MRFFTFLIVVFALGSAVAANNPFLERMWPKTNFENRSIELIEFINGGPGKDGIPSIDDPRFLPVSDEDRLADREPVMVVEINGDHRAYPIRYLMFHEIVNDTVGDVPVAVTFCPLCNSGIVFERKFNDQIYDFGVSGMLRNSDMIMYDRQTETWWQQFTGEALVGDLLGQKLVKIPSWMESWESFKTRNPDGLVLDQPRAYGRYGTNPYRGYDTLDRPFLYNGELPPFNIPPLARVVVVDNQAWPLTRFLDTPRIEEEGLVLTWQAGTASALDSGNIAKGRDVGSIRVQDANGNDVVHDVAFAFAFHAFHPEGEWMLGN